MLLPSLLLLLGGGSAAAAALEAPFRKLRLSSTNSINDPVASLANHNNNNIGACQSIDHRRCVPCLDAHPLSVHHHHHRHHRLSGRHRLRGL